MLALYAVFYIDAISKDGQVGSSSVPVIYKHSLSPEMPKKGNDRRKS
jgi:hypothetical protein